MKRAGLVVSVAVVLAGCGSQATDSVAKLPSWEQFRSNVAVEAETGNFIVNGDEVIANEGDLRTFYDNLVASRDGEDSIGATTEPLIINTVGGRDDKWSATNAQNLTYCVSQSAFGSRYNAVVNAMASASAAWEATANVNFTHVTSADANCTASTSSVLFNVTQTSTTSYLARSFFPSTSRSGRNVVISTSAFGSIAPYTLAGVLRHELGHTIGFRHEHTRPESGTCFEDNNWRVVTSYDSASVMMYPQCNGTNRGDLVLTSRDKSGARSIYP